MVEAVLKVRSNKVVCSENVTEALDTDLCRLECLNSLVSESLYVNVRSGNERNYDRLRRFNAILHKVVELRMSASNKTSKRASDHFARRPVFRSATHPKS